MSIGCGSPISKLSAIWRLPRAGNAGAVRAPASAVLGSVLGQSGDLPPGRVFCDQPAIAHLKYPVNMPAHAQVRCNRDAASAPLMDQLAKRFDHLVATFGVQGGCGLVGRNERGALNQLPADGDTLLLTTRHLTRQELQWSPQSWPRQERGWPVAAPSGFQAIQSEDFLRGLPRREASDQVAELKSETDAGTALSIMRQKEHRPGAVVGCPHSKHGCKGVVVACFSANSPCRRASRNRR